MLIETNNTEYETDRSRDRHMQKLLKAKTRLEELAILSEAIPTSVNSVIRMPFFFEHGKNIKLGSGVFINFNVTIMAHSIVEIGSRTLIGPGASIFTLNHPISHKERNASVYIAKSVKIGKDCWLGGNVTVLPGVTIGDRTVIGAGSVVTKDIPSDVVAVGNPCRVIKRIGENNAESSNNRNQ